MVLGWRASCSREGKAALLQTIDRQIGTRSATVKRMVVRRPNDVKSGNLHGPNKRGAIIELAELRRRRSLVERGRDGLHRRLAHSHGTFDKIALACEAAA